jgi:tetratricopeptide (TPR) repeat protein
MRSILKSGTLFSILLNVLVFTGNLNAQTKTDSLFTELHSAKHVSLKGEIYAEIGFEYKNSKPDSSIYFFKQAIKYFEIEGNNNIKKADILLEIGKYYKLIKYDSAIVYFKKAHEVSFINNYKIGQADALLYEGMTLYNKSTDSLCITKVSSANEIYMNLEDKKGQFECYNSLAIFFTNFGQPDKSINNSNKAIEIAMNLGDSSLLAKAYFRKGSIYQNLGRYSNALKCLFNSETIYNKLHNKEMRAGVLNDIGWVYCNMKEYENSIRYHKKALNYYKQFPNDRELGSTFLFLGGSYTGLDNKLDSALLYTLKGQEIMQSVGDIYSSAGLNINIGIIERKRGNFNDAISFYKKALLFMEDNKQIYYVSVINRNIGNVFCDKKEYIESIKYYKKSIDAAKEIESDGNLLDSYSELSKAYKELTNYRNSLKYLELSNVIKDSINSKENRETILNLETKYQTEQNKLQIQKQDVEIKKKQQAIQFYIIALLLLMAGLSTISWIYRKKQKAFKKLVEKNVEAATHCDKQNAPITSFEFTEKQQDIFNKLSHAIKIDQVYTDVNLTIDSMAKSIQTNRTDLSQILKMTSDKTYPVFINEQRIKHAVRLLSSSGMKYSVEGIANEAGFKSTSNFYKLFKENTGMTPTEFQKTLMS